MTSRERQGWWIAGCLFVSLFLLWGSGYNTAGLFIAPLLKQFGWDRTQVSMLFSVLALASGVSSPLAGRLLERVEARIIIVIGAILSGVGLIAASRANSFGPMLVGYAMLGLGLGFSTFRAHRAGCLELVRRAPRRRPGDRDGRAVARRDGDGAAGRLRDREGGMARR